MLFKKCPSQSAQRVSRAVICILVSLYGVSATEFVAKAGQWEANRSLLLTDLPLPPKPRIVTQCLKPEDALKQPELLSPLKANGATEECAVGNRLVDGASLTAPLSCKALGKSGRLEMTIGREDVVSKLTLYKGESEQAGIWMVITDTYKWTSETCAQTR